MPTFMILRCAGIYGGRHKSFGVGFSLNLKLYGYFGAFKNATERTGCENIQNKFSVIYFQQFQVSSNYRKIQNFLRLPRKFGLAIHEFYKDLGLVQLDKKLRF